MERLHTSEMTTHIDLFLDLSRRVPRQGAVPPYACLFFLAVVGLANPHAAWGREPTGHEQYFLELLNRARANPLAEVTRLSGQTWGDNPAIVPGTLYPQPQPASLNEGLAAGTISSTPKQPLAFHPLLIDAAASYTQVLLANDAFTHTFGGTTTQSRVTAAGYVLDTPWSLGENLSVNASSVPFTNLTPVVESQHSGLFIDGNVPGRGHRINMMNDTFREIGIGIGTASDYGLFPCCSHAVLTTFDFAASDTSPTLPGASNGPFVTGVAYFDNDNNNFYSPSGGEGIGGVAVRAFLTGTATLAGSTTTYGSGGYTLPGLNPGTYDLQFLGTGINQRFNGIVLGGDKNVKVDLIDPSPAFSPGDFDEDDDVDGTDLVRWSTSFGVNGLADADDDTDSDGSDFLAWQRDFGQGAGGLSAPLSVPETVGGMGWFLFHVAIFARIPYKRLRARRFVTREIAPCNRHFDSGRPPSSCATWPLRWPRFVLACGSAIAGCYRSNG